MGAHDIRNTPSRSIEKRLPVMTQRGGNSRAAVLQTEYIFNCVSVFHSCPSFYDAAINLSRKANTQ